MSKWLLHYSIKNDTIISEKIQHINSKILILSIIMLNFYSNSKSEEREYSSFKKVKRFLKFKISGAMYFLTRVC